MDANLTITHEPPKWHQGPTFELPSWGEPSLIVFILFFSMFITRRRNYSIFDRHTSRGYYDSYLDNIDAYSNDSSRPSDKLLGSSEDDDDSDTSEESTTTTFSLNTPPKKRRCCGFSFHTPNSSRFASHYHSRILQKFPFLIEMFYWIITYFFYRLTNIFANAIFTTSIIEVAQTHGLDLLEFEQFSWAHFLFPYQELDLQTWFVNGHQTLLACLNHFYSLVHIPATVAFIAWYYYVAPSHAIFATVRRTLTLTNLIAFIIFTLHPTMPPRLLPPEYGFLDSVHAGHATSIWMDSAFINSLAAMPSMHFGYAAVIGATLIYHAVTLCRCSWPHKHTLSDLEPDAHTQHHHQNRHFCLASFYFLLGTLYPATILLAIIATANHYWADALAALLVAGVAYAGNQVFLLLLPLEDGLLWALRLEKPVPWTERDREGAS